MPCFTTPRKVRAVWPRRSQLYGNVLSQAWTWKGVRNLSTKRCSALVNAGPATDAPQEAVRLLFIGRRLERVDSDPLRVDTTDLQYVMKGGVLYGPDTLDELWPRRKPFGAYPWLDRDAILGDDRPTTYHDRK